MALNNYNPYVSPNHHTHPQQHNNSNPYLAVSPAPPVLPPRPGSASHGHSHAHSHTNAHGGAAQGYANPYVGANSRPSSPSPAPGFPSPSLSPNQTPYQLPTPQHSPSPIPSPSSSSTAYSDSVSGSGSGSGSGPGTVMPDVSVVQGLPAPPKRHYVKLLSATVTLPTPHRSVSFKLLVDGKKKAEEDVMHCGSKKTEIVAKLTKPIVLAPNTKLEIQMKLYDSTWSTGKKPAPASQGAALGGNNEKGNSVSVDGGPTFVYEDVRQFYFVDVENVSIPGSNPPVKLGFEVVLGASPKTGLTTGEKAEIAGAVGEVVGALAGA